jgi:hypothetical protein
MKIIKFAMIIVGAFALIFTAVLVFDAFTWAPTTSLPEVPLISSANCSSSARVCYLH